MSIIAEKIQEVADAVKKMPDTLDSQVMTDDSVMPQEAPGIQNLEEERNGADKWSVEKANAQVDSIARFFRSIAILSLIGLFWVGFMTLDLVLPYPGSSMSFAEALVNIAWILAVAAALSVYVQRTLESSERRVDDDRKDAKKRKQDDNKSRRIALFLFFAAFLVTLFLIGSAMINDSVLYEDLDHYANTVATVVSDAEDHRAYLNRHVRSRVRYGKTKMY